MSRPNGGWISEYTAPTRAAARGIWSLRDAFAAQRANLWPISPCVLLINANSTNGATTFTDSSRYARTVSRTGDPVISTVQSKFGGSSVKFNDGNISVPASSDFSFGTSDFAIEFFAYFTSTASDQRLAGGDRPATSGNLSWALYVTSAGRLDMYIGSTGSAWNIASGSLVGNFSAGQWYHVAIARSGGTIRGYLDGVRGSSVTTSAALFNNTDNGPFFGRQGTSRYTGYLDDIRISVGTDRGYAGASFTPPLAELTQ